MRLVNEGTAAEYHMSPAHPHLFCGCGNETATCHPGRCCEDDEWGSCTNCGKPAPDDVVHRVPEDELTTPLFGPNPGRERELQEGSTMVKSIQVTPATRAEVLGRDMGVCVRCGRNDEGLNLHHRTPRGMGGTRDPLSASPANLVTLCGSGTTGCHGWVESHRDQAVSEGWIVLRGTDPSTVPVRINGYLWVLGHDGAKRPIP